MNSGKKKQFGQGMTEYIIIVALIAVAAITAYAFFGETLRSQIGGISKELAGESADEAQAQAREAASGAVAEGAEKKKLGKYGAEQ
jgi:Flp pilus assembly pilin Flp